MSDYDIKLFATGGTIDKDFYSYDHSGYVVGEPYAPKVFKNANLLIRIACESLAKKDSLELIQEDRDLLFKNISKEVCSRIIITHGTDTVSETAKALTGISGKTIVFTGAMLPGRFIDSDAVFNLGSAVLAVQTLPAGLYLVMHGQIFDPLDVMKDRTKSIFSKKNK